MYDKKFYLLLNYVFADEGGYSNDPDDRGGETNLGISQLALDEYTRTRHLPRMRAKNVNKELATKIYYEDYYLKSGADKQKDIRDAYIIFDTAIQTHPITAQKMFKQAHGDFYKFLELRRQHYHNEVKKDSTQKKYLKGWLARVDRIEKRADMLVKETSLKNLYTSNVKTPFDDDYKGVLNKVNISNPEKKESLKININIF